MYMYLSMSKFNDSSFQCNLNASNTPKSTTVSLQSWLISMHLIIIYLHIHNAKTLRKYIYNNINGFDDFIHKHITIHTLS